MSMLEINLFSIENLRNLTSRYRPWRILGLRPDQPEYHQNCQHLQRLSFVLRQPVLVIERSGEPYLVVPEHVSALPAKYQLVRTIARSRTQPRKCHAAPAPELLRGSAEASQHAVQYAVDLVDDRFRSLWLEEPRLHDPRP
jgi:hypothetical protein